MSFTWETVQTNKNICAKLWLYYNINHLVSGGKFFFFMRIGRSFIYMKLEFPSYKDALCHWIVYRQTDGRTTNNKRSETLNFSSLLRWGEKRNKISSRNLTLSKQNSCCTKNDPIFKHIPIALSSCPCQKGSRMRPYHSYCFRIKVESFDHLPVKFTIRAYSASAVSHRMTLEFHFWTPMANMPEF